MNRDDHLIFETYNQPRYKIGDKVILKKGCRLLSRGSTGSTDASDDVGGKVAEILESSFNNTHFTFKIGNKFYYSCAIQHIDDEKTLGLYKIVNPEDKKTAVNLTNI